jgi:sulfite oxidase
VNKSHEKTAARMKAMEEHGQSMEPITRPLEFPIQTLEEWREIAHKHEPRNPEE